MVEPHPFRFGVQASSAPDRKSWIELAKNVEGRGFDVLAIPDHFDDQLAPVPALMAAASATTELRVGALVWDNDFKHPVVLAKELATMDLLSDGRVEIGIGAGWEKSDYDSSGIPYERAGIRVDRFIEAISIIKGHFAEGSFSRKGSYYNVTDLDGLPKPVQRPHPPILIGAGGPRMLRIAAREANIVGINPTLTAGIVDESVIASMSSSAVAAKIDVVREAAGDRMADIELNIRTFTVSIDNTVERAIDAVQAHLPRPVPPAFLLDSPFALIGPPSKLIEDLLERREKWGLSYVIVGPENIESFAPVVEALNGR